ncbi:MAG TPA: hypothetical protein VD833_25795 [Vicinamibacterales bacterium]|nr:hypothetical protein [Vicinamibacterales bacterium]
MIRNRNRMLFPLVLLACGGLAGSLTAPPVLTAQQPDVLPALLAEVRGLRAAMEQLAAAGPRIQLAMGRLQLQEQRVNTLVRRLEGVRAELRSTGHQLNEANQQQAALERAMREPNPPERQTQLEWELAALKTGLARLTSEYQRLTGDEAATAQEISAEQSRWTEINGRLEELDRALSGPPRR